MYRLSAILGGLIALAAPAQAQRAASYADSVKKFVVADQRLILVRNARLWDGTGSAARPGQDMLVRDGRIISIGRKLKTETGTKVIDGTGQTLMPGLIMMHEHLYRSVPVDRPGFYSNPYIPQIMLAYGTTTARTAGGFDMDGDLRIKANIVEGKFPGSDLDVSIYVDGPHSYMNYLPPVKNAADARREVDYWNARGATSVKLWFDTTPEIARAAIEEGHRLGMTVAAHLCATFAATAAEAGIDTLEHSLLAAYDIVPSASEGSCPAVPRQSAMIKRMASLDANGPEVGAILKTLLDHHVAIDPTLAARDDSLCAPIVPPPPRERALLKQFDEAPTIPCAHFPGINRDVELRSIAFQAATAVRYHRMGGMLVMGTDQGLVPGAMGPRELELMVRAGLTPSEALIAATRNGALKIGRGQDIGTLEVGKRADFLLVDGRPDVNISDIRRLTTVARDGIVYDPAKLYEDAKGKL